MTATPTRRQLLAAVPAAALLPVAACTSSAEPAKVDPDDAIRAAAVERELALIARYDVLLRTSAPLSAAAVLSAVRADHVAHLSALGHVTPSPGVPGSTTGPATGSPVVAERAAAAAHAAAALDASPELASVLASLAASEASHPVALA